TTEGTSIPLHDALPICNREEDATEQEQRGDDEPADGGKAFVLALGGGESEDRRAERKPVEDDDRDHEQRHQRVHRAEENHDKEKERKSTSLNSSQQINT